MPHNQVRLGRRKGPTTVEQPLNEAAELVLLLLLLLRQARADTIAWSTFSTSAALDANAALAEAQHSTGQRNRDTAVLRSNDARCRRRFSWTVYCMPSAPRVTVIII